MPLSIKAVISALIIVAVSEIAKRSPVLAAIIISLPMISILSMIWLYYDTADTGQIIALSYSILWAVLPSLLFFVVLPAFLKWGFGFPMAMVLASVVMAIGYSVYVFILSKFGITI